MVSLVGFYIGMHDSNICAIADDRVLYRKFERRSGVKHERSNLSAMVGTCAEWNVAPEYIAYSDGNRNGLGICAPQELFKQVTTDFGFGQVPTYCIDHHYAHILSATPLGAIAAGSLCLAVDGRGDHGVRARLVRLHSDHNAESLRQTESFAVGKFFQRVGSQLGLGGQVIDLAGKVLGAQALGEVNPDFVGALDADEPEELPRRLLDEISWRGVIPGRDPSFFSIDSSDFLNWLATAHKVLERALLRFAGQPDGGDGLRCFAGGVAQNVIFNEALLQTHPNLLIPPHAYDGGLAIGCAAFLCRMLGLAFPSWPSFPFAQDDEDVGYAGDDAIDKVIDLLIDGKVVGWMQGHGEVGPRALGHRSILADPRRQDARDLLNQRVKVREFWRPYAGSILEEEAPEWFMSATPSPFMLRAVAANPSRRSEIPAVVHADGTCRIQTVARGQPELAGYRRLIEGFFDRTGVPIVLNTSLNAGGEPIFGNADRARDFFASGRLDALCVGDTLQVR
jgi:carbamoyltransferase